MSAPTPLNPDLLELAPIARRVLEIGCGDGAFAAAYRARDPRCHYVGIEADGAAASIAAARVDRLFAAPFAALDDDAIVEDGRFDLILIGALDRAGELGAVLGRVRRLLADDGYVVIGFANLAHWSGIARLMQGQVPVAANASLMSDDVVAALERGGFRLVKRRALRQEPDAAVAQAWLGRLGELAAQMGIDRAAFLDRAASSGYVVVARPVEAATKPVIQLVTAALAPKAMDVRSRLPASHLRAMPEIIVRYQEKTLALPPAQRGSAKILIVQRPAASDNATWRRMVGPALRSGWLVVTEYDDHPELVGKVLGWGPERGRWIHIAGAHAVQTSTDPLGEVFRVHNPEVAVFPNTAFTLPPFPSRAAGPARIFFGALNRGEFGRSLARALAPAIAAHPDTQFDVLHDRAFFDALPTERKSFRPLLDYEAYLEAMGACDIALLPLAGESFELFKSDLKYVEAASRGVAVVASSAVYANSIDDGRTGLIAPGLNDWAPALVRLLDDPGLRQRLARAAWEDVRGGRMFAAQAARRIDWYRRLWEDRARLHLQLLARCPWLAEPAGADPSRP